MSVQPKHLFAIHHRDRDARHIPRFQGLINEGLHRARIEWDRIRGERDGHQRKRQNQNAEMQHGTT